MPTTAKSIAFAEILIRFLFYFFASLFFCFAHFFHIEAS